MSVAKSLLRCAYYNRALRGRIQELEELPVKSWYNYSIFQMRMDEEENYPTAGITRDEYIAERRAEGNDNCQWYQSSTGQYLTDCGEFFEFAHGGPQQNNARYCQYCGKVLIDIGGE